MVGVKVADIEAPRSTAMATMRTAMVWQRPLLHFQRSTLSSRTLCQWTRASMPRSVLMRPSPVIAHQHRTLFGWSWTSTAPKAPAEPAAPTTPTEMPSPFVVEQVKAVESTSPAAASATTTATEAVLPLEGVEAVQTATSPETLTAITSIGDFATLGLGGWSPVGIVERLIELSYVTMGLPWWATIAVTTFAVRVALFPFVIKSQRMTAALNRIKPEMEKIQANMAALKKQGDTGGAQMESMKLAALLKDNKANPLVMIGYALLPVPIFISFFFAIRKMSELPVPGFSEGGLAWFTDLTAYDPTYILPIVGGLGMLVVMEMGAEMGGNASTQAGMSRNLFRVLAVASVPITAQFPAGVFMYWIASNIFTLAQVFMLRHPGMRARFGLGPIVKPPLPKPTMTGYARMSRRDARSLLKASEKTYKSAKA